MNWGLIFERVSLVAVGTALLFACRPDVPSYNPTRSQYSADSEISRSFFLFLEGADKLQTLEERERLPPLLLTTSLMEVHSSQLISGHCIAWIGGPTAFTASDLVGGDISLSPGSRVAYSINDGMRTDECLAFFHQSLGERYKLDFMSIHISLFGK